MYLNIPIVLVQCTSTYPKYISTLFAYNLPVPLPLPPYHYLHFIPVFLVWTVSTPTNSISTFPPNLTQPEGNIPVGQQCCPLSQCIPEVLFSPCFCLCE